MPELPEVETIRRTLLPSVGGKTIRNIEIINPVVLENGVLYLRIVGPFLAILGMLLQTRSALQGIGEKLLPIMSSVIEMVGKILFSIFIIPKFGYFAVIICEPVIWCVMVVELVLSFWRNPFIRGEIIAAR